jgi:hypothetical protein
LRGSEGLGIENEEGPKKAVAEASTVAKGCGQKDHNESKLEVSSGSHIARSYFQRR